MKVTEMNFRDMYHKVCFIITPDKLLEHIANDFPHDNKCNGILTYGYIDYQVGFTFELLTRGRFCENRLTYFSGNDTVSSKFRFSSVTDCDIFVLDNQAKPLKEFSNKITNINDNYRVNDLIEALRFEEILDSSRNQMFPDDILVYLISEKNQPEGCWVRCKEISNGQLFGILLNEPNQDFGIHNGDKIQISIQQTNEDFVCLYIA